MRWEDGTLGRMVDIRQAGTRVDTKDYAQEMQWQHGGELEE